MCVGIVKNVKHAGCLEKASSPAELGLVGNLAWEHVVAPPCTGCCRTRWFVNYLATIWHWVLGNKVRSQLFGNYLALGAAERGGLLTIWYFFVQYLATL